MNRYAEISPAPWTTSPKNGRIVLDANGQKVCTAERQVNAPTAWANATIVAAAFDNALLLREMARGLVRWHPFADDKRGELCHGGLRYATQVDSFGCPCLTHSLRAALLAALKAEVADV